MASCNLEEIERIFKYLDNSRHLPSFRLEPHAAPFFAHSLPQILSKHLCAEIHKTIIPEFPIQKESIKRTEEQSKRNQSFKVDYVAFTQDGSTTFLVELKTDMASKKKAKKQWCYLQDARAVGFPKLIAGVKKLARATTEKKKYAHLLHRLAYSPYLSSDDSMKRMIELVNNGRIHKKKWSETIDNLEYDLTNYKNTKTVYIQPKRDGDIDTALTSHITFEKAAKSLVEDGGELNGLFANYLRNWKEKAGTRNLSES